MLASPNQEPIKRPQFRAVVYAQRNPYEQPVPMTIELRPVNDHPAEGIEFLQLAQPIQGMGPNPSPPVGVPAQRPADPANLDLQPPKK